ncbi:MAG: LexA family transcriptional regulator [Bacteroidia bacterium]|nr:LexA family transcriptional regulator [Bacteroidia bacterium]
MFNILTLLADNLKYLRKLNRQTQSKAADLMGITRTTWINYEKGRQTPRGGFLVRVSEVFDVPLEALMHQNLSNGLQTHEVTHQARPSTPIQKLKEGILLIPVSARAGYSSGYGDPEFLESLPVIQLPNIRHGLFRAFTVEGDSMPPIHDGYIVIGQAVERIQGLTSNSRYIFVTKTEGILFKRLSGIEETKSLLLLSSDNIDYQPFTLSFEEISEIWSFYSFIGYPEDYTSPWIRLEQRVEQLTDTVEKLRNQLLR